MRRIALRLVLAITALAVLAVATLYAILGTESGTRWLLARAAGYLPNELQLGTAEGTLLHGMTMDSLAWRGEGLDASVAQLEIDIGWWPLFDGTVAVQVLDAARVDVELSETETPASSDPPRLPEI